MRKKGPEEASRSEVMRKRGGKDDKWKLKVDNDKQGDTEQSVDSLGVFAAGSDAEKGTEQRRQKKRRRKRSKTTEERAKEDRKEGRMEILSV